MGAMTQRGESRSGGERRRKARNQRTLGQLDEMDLQEPVEVPVPYAGGAHHLHEELVAQEVHVTPSHWAEAAAKTDARRTAGSMAASGEGGRERS